MTDSSTFIDVEYISTMLYKYFGKLHPDYYDGDFIAPNPEMQQDHPCLMYLLYDAVQKYKITNSRRYAKICSMEMSRELSALANVMSKQIAYSFLDLVCQKYEQNIKIDEEDVMMKVLHDVLYQTLAKPQIFFDHKPNF